MLHRATSVLVARDAATAQAGTMPVLRPVLDALVPLRCLGCGDRATPPWCHACAAAAAGLRVRRACTRCGGEGGHRAHPCWLQPSPVAAMRVAFHYRGVLAASVVAGKVRGASGAWPALGAHLAAVALDLCPDVVTWVPSDRRRRRARGFEHTQRLADPVAERLRRPLVRLLEARPGRPDQATRSTAERRTVPADAFRACDRLTGAVVVLVDDVVTTGATVWAAAGALRRAGADAVVVAALCRAGDHPLGHAGPPELRSSIGGEASR